MLVDEEKGLDKGTRQWERLVGESERLRQDNSGSINSTAATDTRD
jgi:hypothetical protein